MEKKIQKSNVFSLLLMNSIKSKKNWFFLSTVIIFVTTLLIPYILRSDGEFFIAFGIVEVFILVFVNCLIDNNFLHNDSKLAYYKSKPISIKKQVFISLITNVIYTGFLLILIALSIVFQNLNSQILEVFKFIIPWLLAGIFLVSLSSILSGNTLVAGAMTVFNFCLPLIFYLIVYFVFSILENVVIGFSADVLMNYFVTNFYKLNYLYFIEYAELSGKSVDIVYILLLAGILLFITLLINRFIKRRKNENTGNFIVFDGYKYFVSVLASLIVPAFFTISSYGRSITSEITVSVVMAILTYYIIIAIMEKSFRISKLSVKVFSACMALFIIITGGTVAFANQYKNVVPEAEDVKFAYVGMNRYLFNSREWENLINEETGEINSEEEFIEWQKKSNAVIFSEKENIENITELHKAILKSQTYKMEENFYQNRIVIAYGLNDGSLMIREYMLISSENETEEKNDLAYQILNSDEMKKNKYYYLYDENYYSNENIKCYVGDNYTGNIAADNIKIEDIREYLIKDIDNVYSELENPLITLATYNYDLNFYKGHNNVYYITFNEVKVGEKGIEEKHIDEITLSNDYTNTLDYLNLSH